MNQVVFEVKDIIKEILLLEALGYSVVIANYFNPKHVVVFIEGKQAIVASIYNNNTRSNKSLYLYLLFNNSNTISIAKSLNIKEERFSITKKGLKQCKGAMSKAGKKTQCPSFLLVR